MPSIIRRSSAKAASDDASAASSKSGGSMTVKTNTSISSSPMKRINSRGSLRLSSKEQKKRQSKLEASARSLSGVGNSKAGTRDAAIEAAVMNVTKKSPVSPKKAPKPEEAKKEETKPEEAKKEETKLETPKIESPPSFDSSASTGSKDESVISASNILSVVLLLMDTTTRKFELVQLEFDAKRAVVADVIAQIPKSAGEDICKNMKYIGVCDRDGKEMDPTHLVKEFCEQNELFIAIPEGYDGKKSSEQAAPILGDPNVVDMLQPTGITLSAIVEDEDAATTSEDSADTDTAEPSSEATPEPTSVVEAEKSESTEKSAALEFAETSKFLNAAKSKVDEGIQSMKDLIKHIESSPTKSHFVLIGFLFFTLAILMWSVLSSGKAPVPTIESIPEAIEMDTIEEQIEIPKKKLFNVLKAFRKGKDGGVEA